MRLIDADALVEAIKDYPFGFRGMIVCDIAKQPTIEPGRDIKHAESISLISAEPKKGKWIIASEWGGNYLLQCSACGEVDNRMDRTDRYCPNCGARMEGE